MKHTKEDLKKYMFKEIEIIQSIIKRVSHNSFIIKGWCLTLLVGTLLLSGKSIYILIALIPLLSFWILDAYFLHLEKLYRKLYSWIIENRLITSDYLFDMDYSRFKKVSTFKHILKTMFSISLSLFYGSLFLITIIIMTIILVKGCI